MSLMSCPECRREVSDAAGKCPGCGAKIKKQGKPWSTKPIWILLGLISVFGAVIDSQKDESKKTGESAVAALTPEQKAKKEKGDFELRRAAAGALALRDAMKDPQAFELTSLVVKPDGAACYDYRAKNTYGAILPGSAVMSKEGKMYVHERDKGTFVRTWNAECTVSGGDDVADYLKQQGIL